MRFLARTVFALCTVILAGVASAADTASPDVTVSSVRRAFHNGEHNAFTDLCRFRGQLYLTFRSCPDGHMAHSTGSVIIMRSADEGKTWQQVNRFSVKNRDTRDPHFLEFKGRLFVYSGTWYCGPTPTSVVDYDMNKLLGFGVSTADGTNWSEPVMLEGTFGYYIWRAASYGGKAYLCGRRKIGFEIEGRKEGEQVQSGLLESDDGLNWKWSVNLQSTAGDETAFLFEKDGSLLAIARDGIRRNAHLLRGQPPYTQLKQSELDRLVGGPLVVRWNDRTIVAGRKITSPNRETGPKTSLCWLVGDTLQEFAVLPSAGDNSYPGFVALSPTKALVSYYSSHERDAAGKPITAIYLAELTLAAPAK